MSRAAVARKVGIDERYYGVLERGKKFASLLVLTRLSQFMEFDVNEVLDGINVTVVHPGTTRTERTEGVVAARAEATGQTTEEVEKQMADGNTIRHIVDATEVAYVVTFLCSPKSIAINGDVIAAGGGALRAIHY